MERNYCTSLYMLYIETLMQVLSPFKDGPTDCLQMFRKALNAILLSNCIQPYVKLWHPLSGRTPRGRGESSSCWFITGSRCPLAVLGAEDTQHPVSSPASPSIISLVPLQLLLLFLPGCMLLKGCHMLIRPEILCISALGEWTSRESLL